MKIKIRPYEASILEEDWLATDDWLAEADPAFRASCPATLWNRDDAIAEAARVAGVGMAPQAAWRTS